MGQASSVLGTSTVSANTPTYPTTNSNAHQHINENGDEPRDYRQATNTSSMTVSQPKTVTTTGKRNSHRISLFGSVSLIDIMTPTQAAELLGESTTRRIIRAYRRTIMLSLSHSHSNASNSVRSRHYSNQSNYNDGYSSDEYDQDESEEEAFDLDDVMEHFFPSESKDVGEMVETGGNNMQNTSLSSSNQNRSNPNSNWLSPQFGIDKTSFPKLILPHHANPPLGVMDCIFTALTKNFVNQAQRSSGAYGNNSNTMVSPALPRINLPDLIIFFAIFLHGSLEAKAAMTFRVYDSFQKQTTVSRETLNRFITAVYSNECAESPQTRKILDTLMTSQIKNALSSPNQVGTGGVLQNPQREGQMQPTIPLLKELNLSQFVRGIHQTTSSPNSHHMKNDVIINDSAENSVDGQNEYDQLGGNHLLISWIQKLCKAMIPDASRIDNQLLLLSKEFPHAKTFHSSSTTKDHVSMNADLKSLYKKYKMTRMMQYECKRKFHSICSTYNSKISKSSVTIPRRLSQSIFSDDENETTDDDSKSATETRNELEQRPHQKQQHHSINLDAFCCAVSDPNPEMGWGGYLPKSLAQLVFQCGTEHYRRSNHKFQSDEWSLYDAVLFACLSLRDQSDENLLKFCFNMFLCKNESGYDLDSKSSEISLDRAALEQVILAVLEHDAFRRERDKCAIDGANEVENAESKMWWYFSENRISGNDMKNLDFQKRKKSILVDSGTAASLQLIPKDFQVHDKAIFLDALVDFALDGAGEEDAMSFEGFKKWNIGTSALRFIVMELKLISGVVFGVPPSAPVQEFILIEEIRQRFKRRHPLSQTMRRGGDGTIWYILSMTWWKRWLEYSSPAMRQTQKNRGVQQASQRGNVKHIPGRPVATTLSSPGEIDNNALLVQGSLAMRRNISFKTDFELVPPLVWQALQAWHDGGPPIHRSVTYTKSSNNANKGASVAEAEIELYPFFLTIALADKKSGQPRPFQQCVPVSKFKPVHILVTDLCRSLQYETENIKENARLWMIDNTDDGVEEAHVLDLEHSLRDQNVKKVMFDGSILMLILELKNEKGEWPRGEISTSIETGEESDNEEKNESTKVGDGIVGLYNMGNTCYLNSSIQCLSHTPLLRQYFTSKAYLKDINTTNIFGHQGRLAQVSAVLINQLWKPHGNARSRISLTTSYNSSNAPLPCPSLTPKSFKEAIGKFNDHFAGNEQHDAQELLSYLLGGLSEDLNRIESKPYIEQPDSDGRPDKELADIWWRNHLLREMSIIVALFTGQYKSLLTCKACRYESARFEPFMYLQLPLPEDDLVTASLVLFPLKNSNSVMKYSVRVRQDGSVRDVLLELSKMMHNEEIDKRIDGSDSNVTSKSDSEEELSFDDDDSQPSFEKSESDDSGSNESLDNQKGIAMAENMAVAEVRDCHVRSITPPTRALSELQSRDTGEMPLLFVYELEKIQLKVNLSTVTSEGKRESHISSPNIEQRENIDPKEQSQDQSSEQSHKEQDITEPERPVESNHIFPHSKPAYIAIAQRKLELLPHPFLHHFYLRTFDTPLLLRISELECYTGKDLYELVARRISRYTPSGSIYDLLELAHKRSKLEHKSDQTSASIGGNNESDFAMRNSEDFARVYGDRRKKRQQTVLDMETVSGGPIPRFGFRLRITSRDCKRCSLCPWFECCIGCVIPDDDYPTIVKDGDSISLDWHVQVYNSYFNEQQKDEKTSRNLDPNDYIKNQSQVLESIESHVSCKDNAFGGGSITLEECLDAFAKEERIPEAYCSKCKDFRVSTKKMSLWRLPPVMIIHLKRFQFTQHMKRKLRNLVVFPTEGLDFSRIIASDDNENNLKGDKSDAKENAGSDVDGNNELNDETPNEKTDFSSTEDGRSESLYDLYGVVHHQGALSTGHYVASLRSEIDGKWRLFNDALVYELTSKEVVDSSAYILFYVRRDAKSAELNDFWDTSSRDGEGLTEEQIDKLTKQRERCHIC